jgi:hypothetical protein
MDRRTKKAKLKSKKRRQENRSLSVCRDLTVSGVVPGGNIWHRHCPILLRGQRRKELPPRRKIIDRRVLIVEFFGIVMFHLLVLVVNKNLPHLNETNESNRMPREVFNNKTTVPKASNALHEIRDWWNEQLAYASQSSDEE